LVGGEVQEGGSEVAGVPGDAMTASRLGADRRSGTVEQNDGVVAGGNEVFVVVIGSSRYGRGGR
jgi:hypothetical protein